MWMWIIVGVRYCYVVVRVMVFFKFNDENLLVSCWSFLVYIG